MLPFIGPLLGAVGTIGASLIGSGRKQETVNSVDYKRMVREAEAAGFNPLTALRAGGAAGFTTTTHPALSAAGGIGAAFANLGQQIADYDPFAADAAQLTRDLQRAQLENIQADTRQRMRSFDIPRSVGAAVVSSPGGWSGTEPGPYTGVALTVTNPYSKESGLEIHPTTPDAAAAEERYGDIMSNVFGVYNAARDSAHNLHRDVTRMINTRKQVKKEKDLTWRDYIPSISWR
jgi:hypothetical protein